MDKTTHYVLKKVDKSTRKKEPRSWDARLTYTVGKVMKGI